MKERSVLNELTANQKLKSPVKTPLKFTACEVRNSTVYATVSCASGNAPRTKPPRKARLITSGLPEKRHLGSDRRGSGLIRNAKHRGRCDVRSTRKKEWFDDDAFWRELYPFMFPKERIADADEQIAKALALTKPAGKSVLDLCCGPGRCSIALAKRGFSVTGA